MVFRIASSQTLGHLFECGYVCPRFITSLFSYFYDMRYSMPSCFLIMLNKILDECRRHQRLLREVYSMPFFHDLTCRHFCLNRGSLRIL